MSFTGNFACDVFKTGMVSGQFNFNTGTTDVFKIALYTNNASFNAATTGYTSSNEVVALNYTAGGNVLVVNQVPTTGGTDTAYFSFADSTWNPVTLVTRGALIYKLDGLTNPAVCVLDFGSDKSTTGGIFTVIFPTAASTSAIIRIS